VRHLDVFARFQAAMSTLAAAAGGEAGLLALLQAGAGSSPSPAMQVRPAVVLYYKTFSCTLMYVIYTMLMLVMWVTAVERWVVLGCCCSAPAPCVPIAQERSSRLRGKSKRKKTTGFGALVLSQNTVWHAVDRWLQKIKMDQAGCELASLPRTHGTQGADSNAGATESALHPPYPGPFGHDLTVMQMGRVFR
jgi:hypothetical protein